MKRTPLIIAMLLSALAVQAGLFGFHNITTNTPYGDALESQLFMEASDTGSSVIFTNTADGMPATVKTIYFGTDMQDLNLSIVSMDGSEGVDFEIVEDTGNVNPPGWEEFDYWWSVTVAAASALPPPASTGIDPGEYLTMGLSYDNSSSFSALVDDGFVHVALHVISIEGAELDGSETFRNDDDIIPEPASLVLIGIAGSSIAFVRRKFIID